MEYKDLIRFVPAGSDNPEEVKQTKKCDSLSLTGEEAKAFYEGIISEGSQSIEPGNYGTEKTRTVTGTHAVHGRDIKTEVSRNQEEAEHTCYVDTAVTTSHTFDKIGFGHVDIKQESCELENFTKSRTDFCDFTILRLEENQEEKELDRVHNKFLSFAQNGDLLALKRLFRCEKELDVNFQDQFGWTALMCAAVSKHFDVITFLLSKGANKYILNNKSQTVLELCEDVGAIDAKNLITSYNKDSTVKNQPKKSRKFFCDVCKREFTECSPREHRSSTVHLFNLKLKPKSDKYVIPEYNKGFQLMKKSGWNGETGLGPSGEGSKYPVKTSLKRDRLCLGADINNKAKITHFGPRDTDAVKHVYKQSQRVMSARTICKRERMKREQKRKQWERNLRTYMSIDI